MRNRAKCKLCNSIIESFHSTDYVVCSCNQIALEGGDSMRCFAKDWLNFIRVCDDDSEFQPQIVEDAKSRDQIMVESNKQPDRTELLDMLDASIKSYDNLPPHALDAPVTHADMISLMLLLQAILRSEDPPPPSAQSRCVESGVSTAEKARPETSKSV